MSSGISIIIPTLGRPSLEKLVHSIERISTDVEIIVCFDSRRPPRQLETGRAVKVVSSQGPGVNRARNEGARQSRGEILWFLDDDVEIIHSNALAVLQRTFADPSVIAAGGNYVSGEHASIAEQGYNILCSVWRTSAGTENREQMLGGTMAVRRSAWEQAGGFDDVIEYGGSETPFVLRLHDQAQSSHGRIISESAFDVHHTPGPRDIKGWAHTAFRQGRGKQRTANRLPEIRLRLRRSFAFLARQNPDSLFAFAVFSVPFLTASKWAEISNR